MRKVSIPQRDKAFAADDLTATDETIRLYRKVTEIMSKLTDTVEKTVEEKLYGVNEALEKTNNNAETLLPNIARLESGIINLEQLFKVQLFEVAKASTFSYLREPC